MKNHHASSRCARPTTMHPPDRAGAAVHALLIVVLTLVVASIDRPAHAEPLTRAGDIQLAGRHEDGKAWTRASEHRMPVPTALNRADDRKAPYGQPAGNSNERERLCHPERTKCWRK